MKTRITDEQIALTLRQAELGVLAVEVCRKRGVDDR